MSRDLRAFPHTRLGNHPETHVEEELEADNPRVVVRPPGAEEGRYRPFDFDVGPLAAGSDLRLPFALARAFAMASCLRSWYHDAEHARLPVLAAMVCMAARFRREDFATWRGRYRFHGPNKVRPPQLTDHSLKRRRVHSKFESGFSICYL